MKLTSEKPSSEPGETLVLMIFSLVTVNVEKSKTFVIVCPPCGSKKVICNIISTGPGNTDETIKLLDIVQNLGH